MIDNDKPPIGDDTPTIPPPAAMICKDCGDFRETTDGILITYCEHFLTGAYFSPRRGHWRLFSPITREEFEAEILTALSRFSHKSSMN